MQHTLVRTMIAVALILSLPARAVAAMLVVAPECWGAEDRSRSFNGSNHERRHDCGTDWTSRERARRPEVVWRFAGLHGHPRL
jgi:hypothetical protein